MGALNLSSPFTGANSPGHIELPAPDIVEEKAKYPNLKKRLIQDSLTRNKKQ
jgi:hypothetical protein